MRGPPDFRFSTDPVRRASGKAAEPSPLLFGLFAAYAKRYMRRHFHATRLSGAIPNIPDDQPLVVYLNHPSWWDPLVCIVLASRFFPTRAHYGPIDSDGLARYPFLRRLGFFGIDPRTRRGAADFIEQSGTILSRPRTMLWVTAQGQFTDPRHRPTTLRPGVAHLARRMSHGTILPLAIEYPFWQERTPEALVRFGAPLPVFPADRPTVGQWNELLQQSLEQAQDELAAQAMLRDPTRFQSLLGGAAGVGGIYDVWRKSKAFLTGRRFSAEHGT